MYKATPVEMLEEAQKLADDEYLLCERKFASKIYVEIEINNEGLVTGARLKSPGYPGVTISELLKALIIGKNEPWEVLRTIRIGIDPRYP